MKEEMSKARGDAEGEKKREGDVKKSDFAVGNSLYRGGRKSTKECRVNHHDAR